MDTSGVDGSGISGDHVDAISGFAVILPDSVGVLRDFGSLQGLPVLKLSELGAEVG